METTILIIGYVGNLPKGIFKAGDKIPAWATHTETAEVRRVDWDAEKITISNFEQFKID
jgi:Cu/Ag efflux protein CusF